MNVRPIPEIGRERKFMTNQKRRNTGKGCERVSRRYWHVPFSPTTYSLTLIICLPPSQNGSNQLENAHVLKLCISTGWKEFMERLKPCWLLSVEGKSPLGTNWSPPLVSSPGVFQRLLITLFKKENNFKIETAEQSSIYNLPKLSILGHWLSILLQSQSHSLPPSL